MLRIGAESASISIVRVSVTHAARRRPVGLLVALAVLLGACGTQGQGATSAPSVAPVPSCPPANNLPGLQVGAPPWSAALDTLEQRLEAIGAPILTREGQAIDRHVRLVVYVDGRRVLVPENVGLNGDELPGGIMATGFVTEMHTHDRSGTVHIHAVTERAFTLGELFDIWGVAFDAARVGGSCASGDRIVRVFVDGAEVAGDRRAVELTDGSTILVTMGTPDQVPQAIPEG